MWAARAWVAGEFAEASIQDDDALADARRWGLTSEEIKAVGMALGRRPGSKLWAMHLDAFRALCAGGTQWRTRLVPGQRGLAERIVGLDYAGLKVALDQLRLALDPPGWERLMVLEAAAAAAMNGERAMPDEG